MIPKIIHYCWFGNKRKSSSVLKKIDLWRKQLPDYQIFEWNEQTFNVNSTKYSSDAYKNRKFAFVSDVARVHALYEFGGIYMDTDVTVLKPYDDLLDSQKLILGFENRGLSIASSTIISPPRNPLIGKMMDYYKKSSFLKLDGSLNVTPNTAILRKMLCEQGLIMNNSYQNTKYAVIYPSEYFSAFDSIYRVSYQTEYTYSVHWFEASWVPPISKLKRFLRKMLVFIFGYKKVKNFERIIKEKVF